MKISVVQVCLLINMKESTSATEQGVHCVAVPMSPFAPLLTPLVCISHLLNISFREVANRRIYWQGFPFICSLHGWGAEDLDDLHQLHGPHYCPLGRLAVPAVTLQKYSTEKPQRLYAWVPFRVEVESARSDSLVYRLESLEYAISD